MASNRNVFYATNPARMTDALLRVMADSGVDLADMLIFLPSRRAVRTVEKRLAAGGACILPQLVPLGTGADDDLSDDAESPDTISDTARVVALARLLAADATIGTLAGALPVARDLVRMTNYLENEGVDIAQIKWDELVDEKYAAHFQNKARLLNILSAVMPAYHAGRRTQTAQRNADIRGWARRISDGQTDKKLFIVCASTASVPATADLMAAIAASPQGRIILPGKIDGRTADFELAANPYNSEYKFLRRIAVEPDQVIPIDVGPSAIDFMNHAFGNGPDTADTDAVRHCTLVECAREAEEAAAAAHIAARAVARGKTVLIITPDAAGGQRIAAAFAAREIDADFSGAMPGTMSAPGRAILNMFDSWIETSSDTFDELYRDAGFDLFETIVRIVDARADAMAPAFNPADTAYMPVWRALRDVSDCLRDADVRLTAADARAFVADALGAAAMRDAMNTTARIAVLGTIESRMQTADVVILTGLNEGMFPARGYENAWLPRALSEKIGLPPGDRKVSLMALDFMNLSCGPEVYWLRSRTSGGVQTTESRFISRCAARRGEFDRDGAREILAAVRARDDIAPRPLSYAPPAPPADWSDVFATELELLTHNPYAFYVRHILRLRPRDDYWTGPDARDFGNLVHGVIEHARGNATAAALLREMDAAAREMLGPGGVIFHFWHKRFVEIAPHAAAMLAATPDGRAEIAGCVKIAGRNVRARADRVWDGGVMDIKTGAAPSKKQLLDGNMPQLPLEAYIMQSGGFPIPHTPRTATPVIMFLQLRNNDVRQIEYDAETTAQLMRAAVDKTTEMFNIYSAGAAPYEYRETSDQKYRAYDDLARVRD